MSTPDLAGTRHRQVASAQTKLHADIEGASPMARSKRVRSRDVLESVRNV